MRYVRLLPLFIACAGLLFRAAPAEFSVASPDNSLMVTVLCDTSDTFLAGETTVGFRVMLDGATVIGYSPLGLRLSEPAFDGPLASPAQAFDIIDETYGMISGKKSLHRNRSNQLTLSFQTAHALTIKLVVRAYDDAAAFRYVLEGGRDKAAIAGEHSAWSIPAGSAAWIQEVTKNYEATFDSFTVGDSIPFERYGNFPALFQTPGGTWILLTEASVYGTYGACHYSLDSSRAALYRIAFPQAVIAGDTPWETPWRVAIIARKLHSLVESNVVENLNPPNAIGDSSWVKPGRAAWSWWSDDNSPESLSVQKNYVDFAKEIGWEYVLVDHGWSTSWMPELVEYGRARGVGILVWYNWSDLDAAGKRNAEFSQLAGWGVKGVKVDFIDNDGQDRMQFYDSLCAAAAEKRLLVNFHGTTLYRGQRRRWPHLMTMEGVRGAEHYKYEDPDQGYPSPAQNCILVYSRNVVGPMDYTPVAFSTPNRVTTEAHELALSVVFESGLQHFADSPQSYRAGAGYRFLSRVPAAWDNTKFLAGYPGRYACIARRKGNDWYIAAINAGEVRSVPLALPFVKPGAYAVDLYADSSSSGRVVVRRTTISPQTITTLSMAANGGCCFVIENGYDPARDSLSIRFEGTRAESGPMRSVVVRKTPTSYEVRVGLARSCTVRLLDMKGRSLASKTAGRGEMIRFSTARLAAGVHVVSVDDGAVQYAQRFVHK